MQPTESMTPTVTQDDIKGVVANFVKAYYQGPYSERSKFYDSNAHYVQHNSQVFVGNDEIKEAFNDFGNISKVSIKSSNRVVTLRNEILLQIIGSYIVDNVEYPFAEALILSPVGQKHYVISDGVFKWIAECPNGFLYKNDIIHKTATKTTNSQECDKNSKQNGIKDDKKKTDHQTNETSNSSNHKENAECTDSKNENSSKNSECIHNGTNGVHSENINDDNKKQKQQHKKRTDKDSPKKPQKHDGKDKIKDRRNKGILHISGFRFHRKPTLSALLNDLNKHFSQYGPVAQVYVPRRAYNDGPLYAFVEYAQQQILNKIFPANCEIRNGQKKMSKNVEFANCHYRGQIFIAEARERGNSRNGRDDDIGNRENNWNGDKANGNVKNGGITDNNVSGIKNSYSNDLAGKPSALKTN